MGRYWDRFGRQADDDQRAVGLQSFEIFFEVVRSRDGIQDEIEIPGVLLEYFRVGWSGRIDLPPDVWHPLLWTEKCSAW